MTSESRGILERNFVGPKYIHLDWLAIYGVNLTVVARQQHFLTKLAKNNVLTVNTMMSRQGQHRDGTCRHESRFFGSSLSPMGISVSNLVFPTTAPQIGHVGNSFTAGPFGLRRYLALLPLDVVGRKRRIGRDETSSVKPEFFQVQGKFLYRHSSDLRTILECLPCVTLCWSFVYRFWL